MSKSYPDQGEEGITTQIERTRQIKASVSGESGVLRHREGNDKAGTSHVEFRSVWSH